MASQFLQNLHRGMEANDLTGVAELLGQNPGEFAGLMSRDCHSPGHCLGLVRSVEMVDLLLRHGLTLSKVSEWWASGFGLHKIPTGVADCLVQRGATLTPHAAAALGLIERLRAMLDAQPNLIHAKGGDGGRPLHFSRNLEVAKLLVERGAEVDPRDDDHDSTPSQWRIGDAPDVTRFLLDQGARPDLFMAVALGDVTLARKLIQDEPACVTYRIGNNHGPFPGIGFGGRGGSIYQWTLGFNMSAQELARRRGHEELFDLLMGSTPPRQRLLIACMLADRVMAETIAVEHPRLVQELDPEDKALLAKCCWETNLNRDAVLLMLDLGFPVDTPEFSHGYQPLHNAAWCGDSKLVELLLQRGHPVDGRDPSYHSTALGFAIHSCLIAKRHPNGDFQRVVQLLLEAGSPLDANQYPTGNSEIDAVIQRCPRRGAIP